MTYREALVSKQYPALDDEQLGLFCHRLANLSHVATCINGTAVVNNDTPEAMYAMAYFVGWKWRMNVLIEVTRREGNPEPDFVKFVTEICSRLGLGKYIPDDDQKPAFEEAMKGRCSLTKTTDGKYAFAAQIAFEAWCKAIALGKAYGK